MSRLATIHRDRTAKRRLKALGCARRVLDRAEKDGVRISVIGSLTGPRFQLHSDVDLFVHGETDPSRRVAVERLVADAFKGTGLPYDVVYESDLTSERAQEFLGV